MKSLWEAGVSHSSTNHVAGFKWRGGPERICRHYSLMTFVSVDFTAVSLKPSLPSVLLTGPLPLSRFLFVSRSLVLSLSLSDSPHSFLELFRFRWRDFMQFLLICLLLQECLYDFFSKVWWFPNFPHRSICSPSSFSSHNIPLSIFLLHSRLHMRFYLSL